MSDPIGFLGRFPAGAVIDEVQRVPDLMSWIQGIVDEQSVMGQFVLTGSQQFDLVAGITQSLAGRAGRLELLALRHHSGRIGGTRCARGAPRSGCGRRAQCP